VSSITIHNVQDRVRVKGLIDQLSPHKTWVVEIKQKTHRRTISQNSLYWKWIGVIADDTGNDADTLHEFFKGKFLPPMEKQVGNEAFLYRTTTKLPIEDMSAYMTRVQAFAGAELGIMLPQPEEQHLASTA
jgi:hypothetical protein